MKIAAIIAEYNPLHPGHLYHIEETKRRTGADAVLILMSGCFVQRGEPAVYDKYVRTGMALSAGADMVIELPTTAACGSAEYFAEGAVRILNELNSIDYLSFGCEYDCLPDILKIADILCEEPADYRQALRAHTKSGMSFAAARTLAIKSILGNQPNTELDSLLSAPNAVLAIEYCKALKKTHSAVTPVLIKREGSGYHEKQLTIDSFPSATAIRKALAEGILSAPSYAFLPEPLSESVLQALQRPLFPVQASALLNDRIMQIQQHFSIDARCGMNPAVNPIFDMTSELSARIQNLSGEFRTWEEWCQALKSKHYAYTRISRVLCHTLLELPQAAADHFRNSDQCLYARILGLRKSSPLPAALRRSTRIPMITKLSDFLASDAPEEAKKQLAYDLRSRDLYRLLYWQIYQETLPDDYRSGIVLTAAAPPAQ